MPQVTLGSEPGAVGQSHPQHLAGVYLDQTDRHIAHVSDLPDPPAHAVVPCLRLCRPPFARENDLLRPDRSPDGIVPCAFGVARGSDGTTEGLAPDGELVAAASHHS